MGYYIETPENLKKAKQLIDLHGAEIILLPTFDETGQKITICVVENGFFDAAAIGFSKEEIEAFNGKNDFRRKTWLTLPRAKVIELCPNVEKYLP